MFWICWDETGLSAVFKIVLKKKKKIVSKTEKQRKCADDTKHIMQTWLNAPLNLVLASQKKFIAAISNHACFLISVNKKQ